tara:strand:+ start:419 stop:544 length:126 start_codon:yes stop_codon:yes gene_type:complete
MRWTEPKDLILIVNKLSEILDVNKSKLMEILNKNAKNILGI